MWSASDSCSRLNGKSTPTCEPTPMSAIRLARFPGSMLDIEAAAAAAPSERPLLAAACHHRRDDDQADHQRDQVEALVLHVASTSRGTRALSLSAGGRPRASVDLPENRDGRLTPPGADPIVGGD